MWLTYWMVFGFFIALETYIGFLLECIPYWHYVRLSFFCWLLVPYFNGADILYEHVLRRALKDHKHQIQDLINATKKAASEAGNEMA